METPRGHYQKEQSRNVPTNLQDKRDFNQQLPHLNRATVRQDTRKNDAASQTARQIMQKWQGSAQTRKPETSPQSSL
jgi:hypothetical protein